MSKKKEQAAASGGKDFEIVIASQDKDSDTLVLTSTEELTSQMLKQALATYDPTNKQYTAYLNETGTAPSLTLDNIDNLADGAQSDLQKILQINAILRKQVNVDDILGMVIQAISNNINTGYKLSYKNFGEQTRKAKTLEKAKAIIDDFNDQINLPGFISNAVIVAYMEGTYMCLLKNDAENWSINDLPLGVAEMSGYSAQGNPIIFINIQTLRSALTKTIAKDRRGKALVFNNTDEEIKAIYNDEVFTAYNNKETYARLDTDYTGTVRINNFGRRYGVSPMLRSLKASIMLSDFDKTNEVNAKSKAKKIIHQKLRKEILGSDGSKRDLNIMAYSHEEFMKAFRTSTVVYTSNAAVEEISYVEPTVEDINVDNINIYRNKMLSSLGISFLANDKNQTASTANISLQQLLQCINTITRQLERVIKNFYRTVLAVNNIPAEYVPDIQVIDSEMLDLGMRMELSKLLYTTFNCSLDTTLNMVGIALEDEKARREKENEDGIEEIFKPRLTAYTNSGANTNDDDDDSEPGRNADPDSDDPDKQTYDQNYNRTR